ncbi:Bifunctional ligase/repressor BirA [Arenibacter antarcticus]|uniref:Biotin--[acetyl-CoA-carboxylase] ligase n=1 Tax=Arenibacter antarcticus TaxID=2040469 RepID=A0ABW5VKT4_9FLAO|nr:biotin--[acetyl-CoA-carboxylase] ligase [Arenibacter sp. H213]MCM4169665.1 biotin--[acetyl-CoA-carboxylase] ligase [Arenibacter sp. H213]
MQLIKLSATDSTNAYLKSLIQGVDLEDFTVVVADTQMKGRGQMGTSWLSEPGNNLTFSVLKKFNRVSVEEQFRINICVSLAIYTALAPYNVPDLKIKWPNDILSGYSKICGILIENVLSGQFIRTSIIGIGLNVNQLNFEKLPNVSSLKLLLGQEFDLEELLYAIVGHLKVFLSTNWEHEFDVLRASYEDQLFRIGKPSTFKNAEEQLFMGFIKGVSRSGKLLILLEDDILKEFDLKEVKLLY